MWKSLIYKEWLKVKWFFILFAAIGILAVGYVFLKVQHDFTFNGAKNYWYLFLFQKLQFFSYLKFVPVAGALAIAVAQYFPETVTRRIKLTFHLPLNENKALLIMMFFWYGLSPGLLCAFCISLLLGLSFLFFPAEIIGSAMVSIAPWFLAGFAVYYLTALIVLEPVWKFRFLYLVVFTSVIPLYFEKAVSGGYAPAIPGLFVLTVILSIAVLFSRVFVLEKEKCS
jgi:hypothetical protein